ncbi:MAG: hypothetical protein AAGG50_13440 [Bacteroidota bacterium]
MSIVFGIRESRIYGSSTDRDSLEQVRIPAERAAEVIQQRIDARTPE